MTLWWLSLLVSSSVAYRAIRRMSRIELAPPPQTLRLQLHRKWVAEVNEDARRRACLAAGDRAS